MVLNRLKIASRLSLRKHHVGAYGMIAAGLLACLVMLNSCTQRQLRVTTPQMDAEPEFWVRVLLAGNVRTCMFKCSSSMSIIDGHTQMVEARLRKASQSIGIRISGGAIVIADETFTGGEIIISPDAPHIFNFNGDDYRGKLKLVVNPDKKTFKAVNLVPLEPYLAGVVGAEMPDYWEPAALRAQAIAARTYCLYTKKRFGSRRGWDVSKTQAHQVYRGVSVESVQVWDAVNKTTGEVLACADKNGNDAIFPTYYSSTCGGHTEDSKNVFGGASLKPLAGVECSYCKDVAKPKYFYWDTVQFDKAEVTSKLIKKYPKLKQLGDIKSVTVHKQSDYKGFSRLTSVKLAGSTGKSDFLRAEDLRATVDPTGRKIKSVVCKIISLDDKLSFVAGRGWGHGVGMCQCGAQGLARKGKTTTDILSHYYPESRIVSLY